MAIEYGIFNDESPDWAGDNAVEACFYSYKEAELALAERYPDDDSLFIHRCEEAEGDELDEDEDEESEDE